MDIEHAIHTIVPRPATEKWRSIESDLLEVKADSVEAIIFAIDGIEGMFGHTTEVGGMLERTKVLLKVEVSNMRKAAEKHVND